MFAITERFGFVAQHFNCSVHLVYWFTSRFTEDVKLCCNRRYIKENKQSDLWSNCLIFSVLLVIRLGAKLLCLQALIFRELRVLLFQSVPILVPLLDPPALTRPLMCGNVLQS